ncbi:MAG: autotransporter domain-containing protein [Sphingobium sp.]|nr:autotransporter domain-containing protein [Sphingobium sp.]
MRILKSTTCLTPIALLLTPGHAAAQVSISTATTTPVRTSTANNGSAADINITSTGSITVNGGAAVTVDSNNAVTNAGTITQGAADGSIGIDVAAGTNGVITNTGTINIAETFTSPVFEGTNVVSGKIAQANNRTGIWVRGAHTGNILQTGSISVEGLDSAGLKLDGDLTGSLLTGGATKVRGDNGVGIRTQGVSGNVVIGGATTVVGNGARAVDIRGDVGGYVRIANAVGQSSTFTDDNGQTVSLARGDLSVGAPAVSVGGNVAGGIVVAAAPTTSATNPDADGDGVADNLETTGAITSSGNGPALLVGNASRNTTLGAVAGDGHGLVVAGSINGNAIYSSNNATALQIGGLGGNVTVTGGIKVTGAVIATTIDQGATAIVINAGSSVPVLDNSGTIRATISSPGRGFSYGVLDLSGTLTTINNSGTIAANGTAQDIATFAIDLRKNTTGVTINQSAPAGTASGAATTTLSGISGNIITGSGDDTITATGGTIAGNLFLGGGNNTLRLSNDAIYGGKADFGTGTATVSLANTSKFIGTAIFNNAPATITLGDTALFRGDITGGSNLTVNVNGGTLEAGGTADVNIKTLNVGANGTIKVDLDTTNHSNKKFIVDSATFATGSKVSASINSLLDAAGTYTVLSANTLTGMPALSSDQTLLPFLFKGSLGLSSTGKDIQLTIARKTAAEVGLNRAQSQAFDAILAAAPADVQVAQSLLGAADLPTLQSQFNQLLPDHAGGNFDLLTQGSRLATRHLANNNSVFEISKLGGWLEPIKWDGSKLNTGTSGYKTSGFGLSMGLEREVGFGHVGLTFNYMSGSNKDKKNANHKIDANAYELGAFWRTSSDGPFYAFARGSVALAKFDSTRIFVGADSTNTAFKRDSMAKWNGRLYSASAGASYELDLDDRVGLKPMVIFDYYRLHEKGYTETGAALTNGSDAIDLTVAPRTSTSYSAKTTLTGIYRFGPRTKEGIPLTIEWEGGRRNIIGGALGDTTAHFANGANFTITPDKLDSAWISEVRLLSGGLDYTWTLAGGLEQTKGKPNYNVSFSLAVAF